MSKQYILILLIGFLLPAICEGNDQLFLSELGHQNECFSCSCLTEVGNYLYDDSPITDIDAPSFKSKNCKSSGLPAPGNKMVASVINGLRTRSSAGSDLENCHDQWEKVVELLAAGDFNKECSKDGNSSELLSRCDEDQFVLSEYTELRRQQSSAEVKQTSQKGSSSCKNVASVFFAFIILVRFENTAFLQAIIESGELKKLIVADEQVRNDALYVVTQHSENFPVIQTEILKLRKNFLEEGIGKPNDVAALTDRIQIIESGKQLYGTHTKCVSSKGVFSPEVDSIEAANTRRFELGLPSVEEFLARVSYNCSAQN